LVVLVGSPDKIRTEEAQLNWNVIRNNLTYSIKIEFIKDSTDVKKIGSIIEKDQSYRLIIDGLLGTGIKGDIREPISSTIDLINNIREKERARIKVASIDVPSGMNPDTGKVPDKAVNTDLVITFHRIKKGMKTGKYQIVVKSIGIPQEATIFVGKGDLIPTLKSRKIDSHKGEFGRVLVIGGSKNYSGAPAYASLTSIRFGCDLVITYVPEVVGNVVRSYSPNMIVRTSPGDWLLDPIKNKDKSIVIDADALKLIKNHLDLIKGKNAILTPHEGELKIMTGIELPPYDEIERRGGEIFNLAKKLSVTLLVKGPYDYISNGKKLKINGTGCPEMSIGGTGDVLAGLCASFLTIENSPFQSACSAAFLNGYIGEFCKETIGPRFTAMDMINNINKGILSL
jgi:NAD(P)H-hydrate epimerase